MERFIETLENDYDGVGIPDMLAVTLPNVKMNLIQLCEFSACGGVQCEESGGKGCADGQVEFVCKCKKAEGYRTLNATMEKAIEHAGQIIAHLEKMESLDTFSPTC